MYTCIYNSNIIMIDNLYSVLGLSSAVRRPRVMLCLGKARGSIARNRGNNNNNKRTNKNNNNILIIM